MERFILHVDVNNAFLSWTAVEKLKSGDNLDIRTIPAVIGGDESQRRGIVLAKSQLAKQFGIKTGEPLYLARQKCPAIKVFSSDFRVYTKYSKAMIEIFKEYTDQIEISIINPSGVRVGPVPEILGPHRFRIGQTEILLYYGEPSPYSISQEIYIDLLPVESYLTEGIWRIVLSAGKIVTGQYEMWLPSDNVLNRGTGFLFPTDATTLTIPSSASRAISVGAYDARTFAYADFSGRGFTRLTNMVKPDLVAPGVEVMTTTVGGGYAAFTGTSFATPFVTGSAALLMEWGIVRGNDPYLYGEKVKAYLRRGAKKVPGFDEYPNEEVGYGALCTAQSIPQI